MTANDKINLIRDKLLALKTLDGKLDIFGASIHKHRLSENQAMISSLLSKKNPQLPRQMNQRGNSEPGGQIKNQLTLL